jgi:two-component sensor histidine kinase
MERLLSALPPRPESYVIRYAVTAVIVGVCFAFVLLLHNRSGLYGFFVFYFAIFLVSVLFDHGSGFFATGLSVLLMYFQLRQPDWQLPDQYVPLLGMFILIALGVALVSEGLRKAWERAVAAERVKDLLLQELRHRTKNDLTMVISVLGLQARGAVSAETKDALDNAMSRIRAIAGVHDHFGPLSAGGGIDIQDYIGKLCAHFDDSLRGVRPIALQVEVESTVLKANDAIPLGLIVNELVTNALKHAFPGDRGGTVRVTLQAGPPRILVVEDDGVGSPNRDSSGIGSRLTRLLVKQLGGTIEWEDAAPGCRVRVMIAGNA